MQLGSDRKLKFGTDGKLHYARAHSRKPWAELFHIQAANRVNSEDILTQRDSSIQRAMYVISSKFAKIVRERLRTKRMMHNRRAVASVIKPSDYLMNWKPELGTQQFCDICRKPTVNRCVFCRTCGCVAHRLCIVKSSYKLVNSTTEPGTSFFQCRHCRESLKADGDYYDKTVNLIKDVNAKMMRQQIIDEHVIATRLQEQAVVTKQSIILIQSAMRKYRARSVFYMWRRTQLRVVVIEIQDIFPLLFPLEGFDPVTSIPTGFVVLTVIDPIKHLQIMRVEKKFSVVCSEGFLLPGISALMQIVVTFYFREPNQAASFTKQQNIMLGQVVLALRDTKDFLLPHTYTCSISKKITWLPLQLGEEKTIVELNTLRMHEQENDYVLCTNTTPNMYNTTIWTLHKDLAGLQQLQDSKTSAENENNAANTLSNNGSACGTPHRKLNRFNATMLSNINNQPLKLTQSMNDNTVSEGKKRILNRPSSAAVIRRGSVIASTTAPSLTRQLSPLPGTVPLLTVSTKSRPASPGTPGAGSRTASVRTLIRPASAAAIRSSRPLSATSAVNVGGGGNTSVLPSPGLPSIGMKSPGITKQTTLALPTISDNIQDMFAGGRKVDLARFLTVTDLTCTLKYMPLNPIGSLCAKILGPPIDQLRKAPQVSMRREKELAVVLQQANAGKRSTHYWLTLNDLWLYFSPSHNDAEARLMGDIREAEVFLERTVKGDVLHIQHADSRKWQLEFEDSVKAVKFHFAITEGQNAIRNGSSIFMKVPRSIKAKPFGFDCHVR